MYKLNELYEVNRSILKSDYNTYSPSKLSTKNTANSQIYINIHREVSVISVLNSYLDLYFDILHAASNNTNADNNDISLVIVGSFNIFSIFNSKTSSGKHLEKISHAHFVSLMYKLITSARRSHDLSIGFDRDCKRRQRELTNNKNLRGNIM